MAHKHALFIGIDDYPMLPGRDLRGCVQDATALRALLADRFGFPADAPLLTNAAATRDGILAAFDTLAARVAPNDQVLVFYAGHGSRIATQAGGRVEALVAHDSGRGAHPNRDVFDFEFDAFVARLNEKTPWVTLVMDCCHSGSVTRDMQAPTTREVPTETRSLESLDTFQALGITPPTPGDGHYLPTMRDAVLLAACRADELANERYDLDTDGYHGAFTWHLLRVLSRLDGQPRWLDVMRSLSPLLSGEFSHQHPVLEGPLDRPVFGVDTVAGPRGLAVVQAEPDGCWIDGGAVHGVALGAPWAVAPSLHAGARQTGTVAELTPLRARLTGVTGAEVGWRAQPDEAQLPDAQCAVSIATGVDRARVQHLIDTLDQADPPPPGLPPADALALRVHRAPGLRWAADSAAADVVIHALPAGPAAGGPLARLGGLALDTWAAVGRDGRRATRLQPQTPEGARALVADLEALARYRALLTMRFDDQDPALAAQVDLQLIGSDGQPFPAQAGHGVPLVTEGQKLDFVITNRGAETVYVHLVQFGVDRAITVLLPWGAPQAGSPLKAKQTKGGRIIEAHDPPLRWAADYMAKEAGYAALKGGAPLRLPDGFPWAAREGSEDAVEPLLLRLLVTRDEADFSFLGQTATRQGETFKRLKERLLHFNAAGESRTFAPVPEDPEGPSGYAVVDRVVMVGRAPSREISPSTGGRVLFYKMGMDGRDPSEVAITATQMSRLPAATSFWATPPSQWPSVFTLEPGDDLSETKDSTHKRLVGRVRYTNPPFGKHRKPMKAPPGMDAAWQVTTADGGTVAWVARAGDQLHWFTDSTDKWLPRKLLRFEKAHMPVGALAFSALDKAL